MAKRHKTVYAGILLEPPPIEIGHLLDPGNPAIWFKDTDKQWSSDCRQVLARERTAYGDRWSALWKHYDIDPSGTPPASEAFERLIANLLRDHVPCFAKMHWATDLKFAGAKLSTRDVAIALFFASQLNLDQTKSELEVAKEVVNKWDCFRRAMAAPETTNKKRSDGLKIETVRKWLPEARDSWCAIVRGNASVFQYQVIAAAMDDDLMKSLAKVSAGI